METTNQIVGAPSIDYSHYTSHAFDFLIQNYPHFFNFLKYFIGFLIGISIPISLIFIIGIIISVQGIKAVRRLEIEKFDKKPIVLASDASAGDPDLAKRWKKILDHAVSPNENDWRQAIIEADIMLDDLITRMGYRGESVGEKLKRAVKGDFQTLNQAWDAHKVRNMIAHDGSDFKLTEHEARRVIDLYRQVFEEFYHI